MNKRLSYFQIGEVISSEDGGRFRTAMMPLPTNHKGEIPQGCYKTYSKGIELPKRRKGQKFIVRFTQVFEKVL
jgi:hypothetical protein